MANVSTLAEKLDTATGFQHIWDFGRGLENRTPAETAPFCFDPLGWGCLGLRRHTVGSQLTENEPHTGMCVSLGASHWGPVQARGCWTVSISCPESSPRRCELGSSLAPGAQAASGQVPTVGGFPAGPSEVIWQCTPDPGDREIAELGDGDSGSRERESLNLGRWRSPWTTTLGSEK